MNISINVSSFCPPRPGKPDPFYDHNSSENRTRIKYNGQKGPTCVFYATQFLRDDLKIGKYPSQALIEDRKLEKIISEWRKEKSYLHYRIDVCNSLKNIRKIDFHLFNRLLKARRIDDFQEVSLFQVIEKAAQICGLPTNVMNISNPKNFKKYVSVLNEELQKYEEQSYHSNFFHYVCQELFINQNMRIDLSLLEKLGLNWFEVDMMFLYQKVFIDDVGSYIFFKDMLPRWLFIHYLTHNKIWKAYGLKKGTWHPEQPLKELSNSLNTFGPHLIIGNIGKSFFSHPASHLLDEKGMPLQIAGRYIYHWLAEHYISPSHFSRHAILLVGTLEHQNTEKILFIDPVDSSDPASTQSQKIYSIDYTLLQFSIATINGLDPHPMQSFLPLKKVANFYCVHA